jgi:hypothetical protein
MSHFQIYDWQVQIFSRAQPCHIIEESGKIKVLNKHKVDVSCETKKECAWIFVETKFKTLGLWEAVPCLHGCIEIR